MFLTFTCLRKSKRRGKYVIKNISHEMHEKCLFLKYLNISLISKADLRQSTRRETMLPRMPRPPVKAVATPPTQ